MAACREPPGGWGIFLFHKTCTMKIETLECTYWYVQLLASLETSRFTPAMENSLEGSLVPYGQEGRAVGTVSTGTTRKRAAQWLAEPWELLCPRSHSASQVL